MILFDAVRFSGLTDIQLPIFGVKANDPFQVTGIDGLGPPELDVLLAENHAPGGIFINRRSQGRQIVVRVGLNPDYRIGQTVSDLRYYLYGLLSPSINPADQSVYFKLLHKNVPVVETVGYIRRIEILPFSKTPLAQITMDCLTPYLEKPEITDITADIPEATTWTIDNIGLAPTGIEFEVIFPSATAQFSIGIQDVGTMTFDVNCDAGDHLVVDTNEATRFVGLKHTGIASKYHKYLEILTSDSPWLSLHGGVHTMITTPPSEFDWVYFRYRSRYWGI